MTITYNQQKKDVVECALFMHNKRSKARLIRTIVYAFALFFILNNTLFNSEIYDDNLYRILFIVIFFTIMFLFQTNWYFRIKLNKLYDAENQNHIEGERTITVTDSNLFCKSALVESTYSWQSFESFHETKNYYFLYISTFTAIVIPKNTFLLQQEAHDFQSFIEKKLAQQKS